MTKPTKAHYEVLKHILRYLAGVKHMRLTWCASAALKKGFKLFQIYSYTDTSWADDKNSRKSTCCYLVFVQNAAFSWRSFMSPIVAMSTSEAELIGACAQEIQFCRKLAVERWVSAICTDTVVRRQYGVYRTCRAWAFCRQVREHSPAPDVYLRIYSRRDS